MQRQIEILQTAGWNTCCCSCRPGSWKLRSSSHSSESAGRASWQPWVIYCSLTHHSVWSMAGVGLGLLKWWYETVTVLHWFSSPNNSWIDWHQGSIIDLVKDNLYIQAFVDLLTRILSKLILSFSSFVWVLVFDFKSFDLELSTLSVIVQHSCRGTVHRQLPRCWYTCLVFTQGWADVAQTSHVFV